MERVKRLGDTLTIINSSPYRLKIELFDNKHSTDDPLSRMPQVLKLTPIIQSGNNKLTSFQCGISKRFIADNGQPEEEYYSKIIKLALFKIKDNYKENNLKLLTNDLEELTKNEYQSGNELMKDILKFFFLTYHKSPSEKITLIDIIDNFPNDNEFIRPWFHHLRDNNDIVLVHGSSKNYNNRKLQSHSSFRLNSKKYDELTKTLLEKNSTSQNKIIINSPIKAFISYKLNNKKLANKIKNELEFFGLEVFVAHDSIKISEEWMNRILKELENCDIFIPLLTTQFKDSDWTDQESGYAIALQKKIFPLLTSYDPHGFLSKYQGGKIYIRNVKKTCAQIFNGIIIDNKYNDRFISILAAGNHLHNFLEKYSLKDHPKFNRFRNS